MRCSHTIDKNTAVWSKLTVQEVGQGHEDRACNTNDLQTLVYFTGSYVQLPSKSPVLPLGVIVPGWVGDRCQVAPPQPIHHAKQSRKVNLSLSSVICVFLLVCLFLVSSYTHLFITSEFSDTCWLRFISMSTTSPGLNLKLDPCCRINSCIFEFESVVTESETENYFFLSRKLSVPFSLYNLKTTDVVILHCFHK